MKCHIMCFEEKTLSAPVLQNILLSEVRSLGISGGLIDNKYQIIKEIGSGGTGVVYLAYHTNLEKYVVMKKIKQWTMSQDMFRREADLLKNLHHTYLPQVYDFITVGDDIYTVIDYIEGCSLEDLIDSGTCVEMDTVKMWFAQLAEVLSYLHNRNPQIIHSDIKPANVLITPDNNICLIDFNISLDGTADVTGFSRFYASPEQIRCSLEIQSGMQPDIYVDSRTDIYSLGATFYHLISGQCPADDSYNLPLTKLMQSDDVFLDIVDRCMLVDPGERIQSADIIIKQLKNAYKMTRNYKLLNMTRWLSVLLGTACICAGVIMCVKGFDVKRNDEFKTQYDGVFSSYRSGDYESALVNGKSIINSNSYKEYFESDPSLKAELLHVIALSFYETEDYQNAAYYSLNAFNETGSSNEQYYFEYITASIRNGDISAAQTAFYNAGKYGLNASHSDAIKIEFLMHEEKYTDVIKLYESHSNDNAFFNNTSVLENYALALSHEKQYQKALEYCQKAYNADNTNHNMRRLGEAYADLANYFIKHNNPDKSKSMTLKALESFESLTKDKYGLSNDYINLLHCYLQLDKKPEGMELVKEMEAKFPSDYRIYAEIAEFYSKSSQSSLASQYAEKALTMMKGINMTDSDRYYYDMLNNLQKR